MYCLTMKFKCNRVKPCAFNKMLHFRKWVEMLVELGSDYRLVELSGDLFSTRFSPPRSSAHLCLIAAPVCCAGCWQVELWDGNLSTQFSPAAALRISDPSGACLLCGCRLVELSNGNRRFPPVLPSPQLGASLIAAAVCCAGCRLVELWDGNLSTRFCPAAALRISDHSGVCLLCGCRLVELSGDLSVRPDFTQRSARRFSDSEALVLCTVNSGCS
ncbi:uncharacterized protein [Nothobranchius furzeri]|uniref:uncharacterized protein n=1 Tax=Nothobranchius furzeri TaxID=105023 RepID=UPI0039048EA1